MAKRSGLWVIFRPDRHTNTHTHTQPNRQMNILTKMQILASNKTRSRQTHTHMKNNVQMSAFHKFESVDRFTPSPCMPSWLFEVCDMAHGDLDVAFGTFTRGLYCYNARILHDNVMTLELPYWRRTLKLRTASSWQIIN